VGIIKTGRTGGTWRRVLSLAAAIFLVSVGLTACGGGDDKKASTSGSTPAAGSPAAAGAGAMKTATVKLGLVVSQSGPAAQVSGPVIDAVTLAVKQINAEGFVVGDTKYTFDLTVTDDKSEPNQAVAAATGLADDKGIKFIFGPVTSTLAPSVAQIILPKKVLMLSGASALDTLLGPDQIKGSSKTLFKTNYNGADFSKLYAAGLKWAYPEAKTIALVWPDDQTGAATAKYMRDGAASVGIQVVSDESFPTASSDYSTVLTKTKAKNPDVLWGCCFDQHIIGIVKQATDLGISAPFYGSNIRLAIAIAEALGRPLNVPYTSIYQPAVLEQLPGGELLSNRPGIKTFVSDFESTLGKKVTPQAGLGFYFYDWVFLLRDAMVKAGTVSDTTKVAEALETVQRDGAIGTVRFKAHASAADADVCKIVAAKPTCTTVPNN
jgi:branched-chain amino acid transport system substrate-binding protein